MRLPAHAARLGSARLGSARLGSARLGSARLGAADLSMIRQCGECEGEGECCQAAPNEQTFCNLISMHGALREWDNAAKVVHQMRQLDVRAQCTRQQKGT